jgi:hypothetical protein
MQHQSPLSHNADCGQRSGVGSLNAAIEHTDITEDFPDYGMHSLSSSVTIAIRIRPSDTTYR